MVDVVNKIFFVCVKVFVFGFCYMVVFGFSFYVESYCEFCGKVVLLKCFLVLLSFFIFLSEISIYLCGGYNLE